MDPRYDHLKHEQQMYALWSDNNTFSPTTNSNAQTFTIIMPPPNANGPLHIGHAMFVALEDILIRYHRMRGGAVLWVPGTDHAGIETQFVFEKKLAKEGKSRFDFDRNTLFKLIWDYARDNSNIAIDQLKHIGASADWSRFTFMLDPVVVTTVIQTFKKMVEDELVYRDLRLVHYCTKCGTAFSELEVDHVEQTTSLYYVRYRMVTDPAKYIVVATTRPEPIFVDTHLAVHPDNAKTKHLIGKQVRNPLTDEPMTIIADEFVDPEFGTGIVKLTPAHDFTDFEVAQKHKLPLIQAIGLDGRILKSAVKYAGLKIDSARQAAIDELTAKDLIEKTDNKYTHRIGVCYRCGRTLEPLPLPQFFVKVKPLTSPILEALEKNELRVYGAGHDKILKHWLENLRDWNISRQIVWGIRLPVWYEVKKGTLNAESEFVVTFLNNKKEKITGNLSELLQTYSLAEIDTGLQNLQAPIGVKFVVSPTRPGKNFLQETDTFDTWFSSAQWPFSTLQNTLAGDFERFYPTQVMETGYDILPFWVMRMLMVGKYVTGKLPFSTVYLHGLVRDQKGQKMSKSKGNVINPLDIITKYGADSLRMALVIRSSPGLDKSVGEQDIRAMRNFSNKVWNATRYLILNLENQELKLSRASHDQDFEKKLATITADITCQLDDYKLGLAAETVYNQFWHWYCDESIEHGKLGEISFASLLKGLLTFLTLMHPFVPFVSEAVYQELIAHSTIAKHLPKNARKILASSSWPGI